MRILDRDIKPVRSSSPRRPSMLRPVRETGASAIDPRTGEVRVVPVPGVRVKLGPREVFTPKPALAP